MTAPLSENAAPDQPPERATLAKTHPILLMVTIGLGVAIILVLAAMVGLLIKRAVNKPTAPAAANVAAPPLTAPTPAAEAVATPAAPVSTTIVIRNGAALAEARIDDGVLILRTISGDADEVITLDPKTGRVIARVTLRKSDGP